MDCANDFSPVIINSFDLARRFVIAVGIQYFDLILGDKLLDMQEIHCWYLHEAKFHAMSISVL